MRDLRYLLGWLIVTFAAASAPFDCGLFGEYFPNVCDRDRNEVILALRLIDQIDYLPIGVVNAGEPMDRRREPFDDLVPCERSGFVWNRLKSADGGIDLILCSKNSLPEYHKHYLSLYWGWVARCSTLN